MGGEGDSSAIDLFEKLPGECIEEVVSRTGPMDACRLSLVSKSFLSAANSNAVWERFLPSDYQQLLNRADSLPNITFANKKYLVLFLIGNHVIIDGNTLCFWLHKRSGKKCFLIAASITGPVAEHFTGEQGWYRADGISRFQNCTTKCHREVISFEIHGKISTSILSPDTTYTIYLVFHSSRYLDFFVFTQPVEVSIRIDGVESMNQNVYLNAHKMRSQGDNDLQYPQQRKDGRELVGGELVSSRFEVRLGEYFNRGGEEMNIEIAMMENSEEPKRGPEIEGIELRPKGS